MIRAIDERHVHGRRFQRPRGIKSAEATTDDDHARSSEGCHARKVSAPGKAGSPWSRFYSRAVASSLRHDADPHSRTCSMRRAIVLDLNETLLDMSGLDPEFARLFGDRAVRREWFSQVLQLSLVATLVDQYRSFDKLAVSALAMVARQRGKVITDEEIANVMVRMRELAMYP